MKYDAIIVRFGELFLKGKNRRAFIDRTVSTIRLKLQHLENKKITSNNDSVLIMLHGDDSDEVIKGLNYVFGLKSYGLCKLCETDLEKIKEKALEVATELYGDGETKIKVESKRRWKKFPLNSIEISQQVAYHIGMNSNIDPVVRDYEQLIRVNVREKDTLIISKQIDALGGMPVGSAGRTLLMLSGGLDSPVAAYLLMKRGLKIEALHFESPPHTSVKAKQKVFDLAAKLAHFMPNSKIVIHAVPFTKLQKEIFAKCSESYGMTIMRRMMYRVADRYARKKKVSILSNGESLGQVASQTPESMVAINAVTNLPVIRPVGCMDKTEIMKIAHQIDTYDISIRPFEDCCTVFVPKNPSTKPKVEKCEEYERRFNWDELVDECVHNIEKIVIEAGKPIQLDEETTDEICSLL